MKVRKALLVVAGLALGIAAASLALRARTHRAPGHPDCRTGPTTPGIDVSYHQRAIDWPRVRRAGIRFAFIRVSDGANLRDTMFATTAWAADLLPQGLEALLPAVWAEVKGP